MRNIWKAAAAAFALGTLALAGPAAAQDYGPGPQDYPPQGAYGEQNDFEACMQDALANGYSQDDAYERCTPEDAYNTAGGGYCDQYGCPDDYYDLPLYYGPVYYGDNWYNGPLYYRDRFGGRQYWIHGGWHADGWHGARPSWWNAGRYHTAPALGRNYYESRGFRGGRGGSYNSTHVYNGGGWSGNRGGFGNNNRFGGAMDQRGSGYNYGSGAPQRQYGNGGGHTWGGSGGRSSFQAQPQSTPQPQHQFNGGGTGHPYAGGGNGGGHSFSGGGGGGWHGGGGNAGGGYHGGGGNTGGGGYHGGGGGGGHPHN